MLRTFTTLLVALAALNAAQAAAQEYNLGERAAGQTYPLSLSAHNADCPEPLDFRFVFEPGSWLRPRGETIVRGVPMGATRPLQAIVDLSQAAHGALSTRVDVVCDNCQGQATCTIDRQSLTISVTAVAPPSTTRAPTPAPPARPRPAPSASTAPALPTPPIGQLSSTTAPAPAPAPVASSGTSDAATDGAAACEQELNTAYAAALIAMLAALGCGFWAMNASHAARLAPEAGTPDGRLRNMLQERAGELQEFSVNCRQDLLRLANAQVRALRALSALGLIQRDANAADIEAWSRVASGAGLGLSSAGAAVIGKGDSSLSAQMESTADTHQDTRALFAPLDALTPAGPRLAWLENQGFGGNDAEAQDVLNEIANIFANGGVRDAVERLKEAAAECAQADAELAAAVAQAAVG